VGLKCSVYENGVRLPATEGRRKFVEAAKSAGTPLRKNWTKIGRLTVDVMRADDPPGERMLVIRSPEHLDGVETDPATMPQIIAHWPSYATPPRPPGDAAGTATTPPEGTLPATPAPTPQQRPQPSLPDTAPDPADRTATTSRLRRSIREAIQTSRLGDVSPRSADSLADLLTKTLADAGFVRELEERREDDRRRNEHFRRLEAMIESLVRERDEVRADAQTWTQSAVLAHEKADARLQLMLKSERDLETTRKELRRAEQFATAQNAKLEHFVQNLECPGVRHLPADDVERVACDLGNRLRVAEERVRLLTTELPQVGKSEREAR
jgi:hypothetical protein